MEFPYVNIEGCFMPMLKVTLRKGEHEIDAEALVDSGSMRNIFDAELASLLGIDDIAENGIETEIFGVTGEKRIGYAHDIVLGFSDYQINTNIVFLEGMPDLFKAILGQEGFFDIGSIRFRYPKRVFEISVR